MQYKFLFLKILLYIHCCVKVNYKQISYIFMLADGLYYASLNTLLKCNKPIYDSIDDWY